MRSIRVWFRRALVLWISFFLQAVPVYPQLAENDVHVVLFFPDHSFSDPTDAIETMSAMFDLIKAELNDSAHFTVKFFKKEFEFNKHLQTNPCHFAIVDTAWFLENHLKFGCKPLLVGMKDKSYYYQKSIYVLADSGIKSVRDLRGETIAVTAADKYSLKILSHILFQGEIDINSYFKTLILVDSMESAIYSLRFKEAAAAVLTIDHPKVKSMELTNELERILMPAKILFPPLVFFESNVSPELVQKVKKSVIHLAILEGGQNILSKFGLSRWETVPVADYQRLEAILQKDIAHLYPRHMEGILDQSLLPMELTWQPMKELELKTGGVAVPMTIID
ncbi:phosphate/phosphite/phosphonate ABC transporter substrate-binding protein [candidate division CSSED10-310 bacterium]|uniref:Phosphate/phosphite/phosphonate ABC transporter substrate-binding protein n=1 Tax=candidate division CSSED10-310 bacterium TaxID=2855610 RepID=A0ABV6Z1B1_UNCC1